MNDRPRHPSGRPIRREQIKPLGFRRVPHDEPLTPGLRRYPPASAIGFTARLIASEDDDE